MSYDATNQNESTVVLIDDEYINKFGGGEWPLLYSEHARLVNIISSYQPRTIFIDFYFKNRTNNPGEFEILVNELKRIKKTLDIPIYIAAPKPDDQDSDFGASIRKPLLDYTQAVYVPPTQESLYPLLSKREIESTDQTQKWGSAAYVLFEEYCEQAIAANLSRLAKGCNDLRNNGIDSTRVMYVKWSAKALNHSSRDTSVYCEKYKTKTAWVIKVIKSELFGNTNFIESELARENCPYTPTVYATDLRLSIGDRQAEGAEFFRDRVVFIGGNFKGINDQVWTPVNGFLPGVYFHAMAFDNLLTYGDEFYRYLSRFERGLIDSLFILNLVICLILARHINNHIIYKSRFANLPLIREIFEHTLDLPTDDTVKIDWQKFSKCFLRDSLIFIVNAIIFFSLAFLLALIFCKYLKMPANDFIVVFMAGLFLSYWGIFRNLSYEDTKTKNTGHNYDKSTEDQ